MGGQVNLQQQPKPLGWHDDLDLSITSVTYDVSLRPSQELALPRPLARSRKSAAKREAIIRAAIEIINEKSYALATMTDIAASLDLSDAALYHYFDSKLALAYACHLRSLERFDGLLRAADLSAGPGIEKLTSFLQTMMDDAQLHGPGLYLGDYSYLMDDERLHVSQWTGRLTTTLERFLQEGMADGSIVSCDPGLVVQLLLGMLIWLAKWVPAVPGMRVADLMSAIKVTSLYGLRSDLPRHALENPAKN